MEDAAIKLHLLERLASLQDATLIRQIAALLNKTFPEVMEGDEDDITDEEYAAFQEELARGERGEIKFHSREESMRMIRDGDQE